MLPEFVPSISSEFHNSEIASRIVCDCIPASYIYF